MSFGKPSYRIKSYFQIVFRELFFLFETEESIILNENEEMGDDRDDLPIENQQILVCRADKLSNQSDTKVSFFLVNFQG